MILLHSSDLHGHWDKLLEHLRDSDYDVWVDCGDFFPNKIKDAYQNQPPGSVGVELPFQRRLFVDFKKMDREITEALAGRPCVIQPGNHDYFSLAKALRKKGANVYRPKPYEAFELLGYKWSGFRDIPWINGTWNHECQDLTHLVESALSHQPDILVTHANPLLEGYRWGSSEMVEMIVASSRPPRYHFFGHTHEGGGDLALIGGTLFVNGATKVRLLEL